MIRLDDLLLYSERRLRYACKHTNEMFKYSVLIVILVVHPTGSEAKFAKCRLQCVGQTIVITRFL